MRRSFCFLIFLFLALEAAPPAARASQKSAEFQSPPVSQISVSNISYSETEPGKFLLSGDLQNPTQEPREVVIRGLLTVYDQTAPKGDLPLFALRKDMTLILRSGEGRTVEIPLINEGGTPRGALRIEPLIRVRRQRVWNY